MKNIFFTLIFILFLNVEGFSQLKFWNNTGKDIWIAISYITDTGDFKGWVASGWYQVQAGETLTMFDAPSNRYYYFYAYSLDGTKWEGEYKNAVNPNDKFTIYNSDKDFVLKNSNGRYEMRGFKMIDMGENTYNFTYELVREE